MINACVARYLRLRVDGQRLQLMGIDAGRHAAPRDVEEIVLTTGNREPVTAARELTFAMTMGGMSGGMDGGMRFTIDGREFDPDRVDQVVRGGTVEEWTITNEGSGRVGRLHRPHRLPLPHPRHEDRGMMGVVEAR